MNRIALALLFAVVLIGAAVAFAPLSAVLALAHVERLGLSAAAAQGSVWSGRLVGARLGGVSLGDVDVELEPLALLAGSVRLHVEGTDGAFAGRAVLSRQGGRVGLEAVTGEAPLSLIRTATPLPGALRLEGMSVAFENGRCVAAQGRATTVAQPNAGVLAPPLSGEATCRDGALLLPLQGQSAAGVITVTLAIQGDGRYRAETRVVTTDPSVDAGLRLAGFAASGGAQVRTEEGRLWRQ